MHEEETLKSQSAQESHRTTLSKRFCVPKVSGRTRELLMVLGVSMLSTVTVLAIVGVILWHNRAWIATAFFPGATALVANFHQETKDVAVLPQPAVEEIKDLSVADVVSKVNKGVVAIEVYKEVPVYASGSISNPFGDMFPNFFFGQPQEQIGTEEKKIGGGSGFFVTSDGMIVTNRHVVDFDTATFKIVTTDGKKYNAKILAKDDVLDVAVLKASGKFTPVVLGDSDALVLGQSVVAIGNALGEFKNSVSTGIISGLSRNIVAGDSSGNSELLDKVIQTDAAINPGNSGGPLLNLRGEVVGVNVAVAQGSQNIAFSLPINSVKTVIDSVQKNGTIIRPYLGIRYMPITPELQKKNNLSVDYGIIIGRGAYGELAVIPGSPADRAGLLENDIILSIDGVRLTEDNNFAAVIRGKSVGQTITLQVISKGVQKTVRVTLVPAPTN